MKKPTSPRRVSHHGGLAGAKVMSTLAAEKQKGQERELLTLRHAAR
jgi:hypothetical protein